MGRSITSWLPENKSPEVCLVFEASSDELPFAHSDELQAGAISLRLARIDPGEPARGFVPSYHFRMINAEGLDVGHLNFRVGDTEHVQQIAGHIGYHVAESF